MTAKKLISGFVVFFSILPAISFAQNTNTPQGAIILDFGASWCPPCQKMMRDVFPDISKDYVFIPIDADAHPDKVAAFEIKSLPTVLVLDANGNVLSKLEGGRSLAAMRAALANVGMVGLAEAKKDPNIAALYKSYIPFGDVNAPVKPTVITPTSKPKPPATVPAPKPKPAGGKPPASPTKPPSIPVPPDQVPNTAFVNPLTCKPVSDTKYSCEYVDSKGKKQKLDVVDDPNDSDDFFDAIKSGVPIMATDSGLFRPFPPKSDLPSTLPPVPGDVGYVPPAKPCPKPIPGNGDWTPIPKPPSGAPILALNGRGCIVTFPGMVPIEITGQEIDDFYGRSNAVQGDRTRCEVAQILAAQKNIIPAPQQLLPPVPVPKVTKYTLEEPQPHKTLKGFWIIKGQACTGDSCTPFTLTVPAGSMEDAKKIVEAQLKAVSGNTPSSIPVPAPKPVPTTNGSGNSAKPSGRATVTPNAPPPGGAVADPSSAGTPLTSAQAAEVARKLAEEDAEQAALKAQINAIKPKSKP